MKRLLLTSVLIAPTANAAVTHYTCEDMITTHGQKIRSWDAILDADIYRGTFKRFTSKGATLTGMKANQVAADSFNFSPLRRQDDAPALVVYEKELGDWNYISVHVYDKAGVSAAGDVIQVFPPPMGQGSYFCYKKGSPKDKFMSQLRESHNSRS